MTKQNLVLFFVVFVAIFPVPQAIAAWQIDIARDQLNQVDEKYGNLEAKASDGGVSATLKLFCGTMKQRAYGMALSVDLVGPQISGTYRIDDRPSQEKTFIVFGLRNILFVEAPPLDIIDANRFRVQIQAPDQSLLFFDFDLTGITEVGRTIGCGS